MFVFIEDIHMIYIQNKYNHVKIKCCRQLSWTMSTMASEIHSTHPARVPPRRSLWRRQHPTETDRTYLIATHISCSSVHIFLVVTNMQVEQCKGNTYTFHFQFSEESASHKHAKRDGEDEYER